MQIVIDEQGCISMVYSDALSNIPGFHREISRLSSVEPGPNGQWIVQFLHEDTPRTPQFKLRTDALAYEQAEAEKMLAKGVI